MSRIIIRIFTAVICCFFSLFFFPGKGVRLLTGMPIKVDLISTSRAYYNSGYLNYSATGPPVLKLTVKLMMSDHVDSFLLYE